MEQTVWLQRGRVVDAHLGVDARGFWLNPYTLLAVYTRHRTSVPVGFFPSRVHMLMHARNMSAGPDAKGVELRLQGLRAKRWEKNWAPFVHEGQLYMSYVIWPEHIVLRCSLERGVCIPAFNSSSPKLWSSVLDHVSSGMHAGAWYMCIHIHVAHAHAHAQHVHVHVHIQPRSLSVGLMTAGPRLSTPPMLVDGRFISAYHFRPGPNLVYFHGFFEMQAQPPFALLRTSRVFRVQPLGVDGSTTFLDVQGKGIQYIAGLHLSGAANATSASKGSSHRRRVVISYGAFDKIAMTTSIRLETIYRLLADVGETRYASCTARWGNGRCDETSCARGREEAAPERGQPSAVDVTLAVCPLACGYHPYTCDDTARLARKFSKVPVSPSAPMSLENPPAVVTLDRLAERFEAIAKLG